MKAPWYRTALIGCLFLAGCGGMNAAHQMLTHSQSAAAARSKADAAPTPPLRIPPGAVASAQDIPLVPVPPIPLGRGAAPTPRDEPRPNLPQAPPSPPPPVPGSQAPVTQASAEASPSAPRGDSEVETSAVSLRQLHRQVADWYASVDSYIVRLTRREQVNGTAKPEEVMVFRFRKEPWSVHMKWLGKVGQDREVLYVKGQLENKIHTRLAAGDVPLMPAGFQMSLPIDSSLVRSASRHSITEAGIGACIDRLGAQLDAQERGDKSHGVLTDLGMQKRPEFARPVRAAQITIPAGIETDLLNGGRRLFFLEPDRNYLSFLLMTYDDKNQEVEYYFYDRVEAPAGLDAKDFDPERLWSNGKTAAKP